MMKQEKEGKSVQEDILSNWMKSSADFWRQAAGMWPSLQGKPMSGEREDEKNKTSAGNAFEPFLEFWQSYFSFLNKEMGKDIDSQKAGSLPEIMTQAMQPLWDGYLALQRQWMEGKQGPAHITEGQGFADLARNMSKSWFVLYEKEFRQILNMPQLGLTRFYQERAGRAVEKFTEFQSSLGEFIQLLYEPMEKSLHSVQDEISKMKDQGEEALKDSKAYYQLWIKKLEEHYLSLLRSQEYGDAMRKILTALREYRMTKEQLLIDALQDLPVPTNRDMEELYKDLYILKKRVRELEKRGKRNAG